VLARPVSTNRSISKSAANRSVSSPGSMAGASFDGPWKLIRGRSSGVRRSTRRGTATLDVTSAPQASRPPVERMARGRRSIRSRAADRRAVVHVGSSSAVRSASTNRHRLDTPASIARSSRCPRPRGRSRPCGAKSPLREVHDVGACPTAEIHGARMVSSNRRFRCRAGGAAPNGHRPSPREPTTGTSGRRRDVRPLAALHRGRRRRYGWRAGPPTALAAR
jgi:hypothetical protein